MRWLMVCLALIGCVPVVAEPLAPVVDTHWLAAHLNDEDLIVIDSTVLVNFGQHGVVANESGITRYREAHIPGAIFADLLVDLSAPAKPLVMPDPDQFAIALGKLGISRDHRLVIYSSDYYVWATRLWWMLRWIGHDNVAVLDGGLAAWRQAGLPLVAGDESRAATQFIPTVRSSWVSTSDDVQQLVGNPGRGVLIDALPAAHFRGEVSLYGRPGHIPTARNLPTTEMTDAQGRFRPIDEIEMLIDLPHSDKLITYCGSGVAATGVAFAARLAGYRDVSVYMGSLSEWAADPTKPMQTLE